MNRQTDIKIDKSDGTGWNLSSEHLSSFHDNNKVFSPTAVTIPDGWKLARMEITNPWISMSYFTALKMLEWALQAQRLLYLHETSHSNLWLWQKSFHPRCGKESNGFHKKKHWWGVLNISRQHLWMYGKPLAVQITSRSYQSGNGWIWHYKPWTAVVGELYVTY